MLAVAADVASAQAIEHWHQRSVERFGGIDLLFTNSGGPPPGATLSFDDACQYSTGEDLAPASNFRIGIIDHDSLLLLSHYDE